MTKPQVHFAEQVMFPPHTPQRTIEVAAFGESLLKLAPKLELLFIVAGNPISTSPNQRVLRQELLNDSLFTVVHEQFLTDTTDYADLVLPASTFLESEDWHNSYGSFDFGRQRQVIPPRGESCSTYELTRRLAQAMGLKGSFFDKSESEALRHIFQHSSLPWQNEADIDDGTLHHLPLVPPAPPQFYFQRPEFLKQNLPPFPGHYATSSEEVLAQDPDVFRLMSPPSMNILNSSFAGLHDGHPNQSRLAKQVLIHPHDAARYGISEDEVIELINDYGEIKRMAHISEQVQPGLVVVEGLFWEKFLDGWGSVNQLTSPLRTAMSGIPCYHHVHVRLRRAGMG